MTAATAQRRLIFAYSSWDIVPVLAALAHAAFVVGLYFVFVDLPWYAFVPLALVYAVSISWNINGIAHNHIHNPYFRWQPLNRAFSMLLSLTMGFSQTDYHYVHLRHHVGNSDRPGPDGKTLDPLSIYRCGRDGRPENVWRYTFLSYFRDDPTQSLAQLANSKRRADAQWGRAELVCVVLMVAALCWLNWRFVLAMIPFYYLGHSLSSLNGFYEHYRGNPDVPIAWGVSSYNRFYNWLWFYNGYHAEHHYRPRQHWTRMRELHLQIAEEQQRAGVRVINTCHALGFLDPDHPPHVWDDLRGHARSKAA